LSVIALFVKVYDARVSQHNHWGSGGQPPGQGQHPGQHQAPYQGQPPGQHQAPHQGQYPGHAPRPAQPSASEPHETLWKMGLVLTILGCVIGLGINIYILVFSNRHSAQFDQLIGRMGMSALLAYLPVALYLFVPWFVDRYDPEPWWALLGVFMWGALFATGMSLVINTVLGGLFGSAFGTVVSAPFFEELTKGLAIVGMVVFLKREFDGVVDGIIYGIFVGIGFAATENVIYYTRAYDSFANSGAGNIFVLRGVLTPWLHPFFTAMTGVGFGIAREHGSSWGKVVFPFFGFCVAVFMHAWWNGMATFFPRGVVINLILGVLMGLTFFVVILVLVYRKGQTIKKFLEDEVLIGTISQEEFVLITSYFGRFKARASWRGSAGAAFVRAGARLALSKWHAARAMKGQKKTVSIDFIVPLRQDLARLRAEMQANQ
jgi:RsiW-degrading membrane proteinase PrsW (M82 family)